MPVSIRIVVVFPAPLGPKNPKISPFVVEKLRLSTAKTFSNCFVRPIASTALSKPFHLNGGLEFLTTLAFLSNVFLVI